MRCAKNLLALFSILLINLAAAYGEMQGTFIAGFYVDLQVLGAALFFILFFAALVFVTRKAGLFTSETTRIIVSMILAAFGVYGLFKLGIDFEKIVFDLGIQDFMMNNFPIILVIILAIVVLKWGFGVVFMISGGILFIAGIAGSWNEDIIYNHEYAMFIGIILILFGLWFSHRQGGTFNSIRKTRRAIKKLERLYKRRMGQEADQKELEQLEKRIIFLRQKLATLEANRANRTRRAQKIGRNIRAGPGGFKHVGSLRRGGIKKGKSKFISKETTARYAKIYGSGAAKRRFKK